MIRLVRRTNDEGSAPGSLVCPLTLLSPLNGLSLVKMEGFGPDYGRIVNRHPTHF